MNTRCKANIPIQRRLVKTDAIEIDQLDSSSETKENNVSNDEQDMATALMMQDKIFMNAIKPRGTSIDICMASKTTPRANTGQQQWERRVWITSQVPAIHSIGPIGDRNALCDTTMGDEYQVMVTNQWRI